MNSIKSSLSKLSAVAVVLGMAACSHNQQPANVPQSAEATGQPTMSEQYGSAMGQPGATGTEAGQPIAPSAQPGATPGTYGPTGTYPQTGTYSQGQTGQTGQMGQGQMGQGQMAPGQQGQMGQGQMGGQGMTGSEYGAGTTGAGQVGGQPGQPGQPSGAGVESGQPGMGGAAGATGIDVSSLNDNQLAAVLQAVNQGEVQEAQLAESKARSPEVKAFARRMLRDHGQALSQENASFSRLLIVPSANPISQQLQSEVQTHLSDLQGLRGNDFDRSYVGEQIKDHNNALELLDRAIPNVKNAELKAEMQSLRAKIASHLAEAERIQQTLQQGSTNQGGSQTNPSTPTPSPNPYQHQHR